MISYNPQLGSALYKWDYEAEMRLKERHPEYKKFLEEYISIQNPMIICSAKYLNWNF